MSYDDELERIKMRKLAELMSKKERPSASVLAEPVELTDSNFDEFVTRNSFVVVDFWAEWCAPCRAIAPVVKELANQYAGKVAFGKLNVDENPQTASRFGIMGIPTLLFFKGGKLVDMVVGAVPKRVLEARISQYV
ncbi:MAG: thioredoxin [Candidatus Caldarchaeum sp.]|nr:thioredoxin [Candidatus Caldarchaeum sp.]MDW8062571.1 thioredoxin [Candidatus Caldarchaeum sp.]MDW8435539.1 thioredoxin [Candidatus Caldarchaeum sp.]